MTGQILHSQAGIDAAAGEAWSCGLPLAYSYPVPVSGTGLLFSPATPATFPLPDELQLVNSNWETESSAEIGSPAYSNLGEAHHA